MKKLSLLLIVLLLIATFMGCSSNDEAKVLKVGMELKYPPFETIDQNGDPYGVSVDMANSLGEYLGMEVEIIDTAYPSLIPALESNNIDIIISSMSVNEERLKIVDFSDTYATSQLMMLVHENSIVQSQADLDNPDVIVVSKAGTIGALWAQANAPNAQIKAVDEEATAVLEVSQGTADVFIYDPLSIIRHNENYPDTTRAILEPLNNTQGWGIALRKGEDDLRNQINEWLAKAKTDGTFDEIREKHLQEKIQEFEKYNLDFFF